MVRLQTEIDRQTIPQSRTQQATLGFSLVEVMVAMVIGMLGIIVMMQMFRVFEGQKRTSTGGSDAISSGAISLYGLQRDIRQSGWGISSVQLIGCSVTGLAVVAIPLAPVTINSGLITGADDNTDTLLVVSGDGNATVEGNGIGSVTNASYAVFGSSDFSFGDVVVGVPKARPVPCNLTAAPVSGAVIAPNVTFNAAFPPIPAGVPLDRLFNLGQAPTVRGYAIRNGNLTMCDYTANNCGLVANNGNPAIWVPIASNVVSLRAEYGRDTTDLSPLAAPGNAMDGVVDQWDQTAPLVISTYAAKNTLACALIRVPAVRVVLVARSSQPEKTLDWPNLNVHVTNVNPLWMGTALIDLSATDPDPTWPRWQDFRYKVFQTVIPLRNMTTQGAVPEC